jgi:hypothetical protein
VLGLLAEQRRAMAALWDEVSRHNDRGKPPDCKRVSFYCGQLVTAEPGGPIDDAGKETT